MASLEVTTLPNILSLSRFFLAPIFILLVLSSNLYSAAAVFIIAGLTDVADGYLARRLALTSELGAAIDPLADKFLYSSAFFILAFSGLVPAWLAAVVILRDTIILTTITVLKKRGRSVNTMPSIVGKISTSIQFSTAIFVLLGSSTTTIYILYSLTILFTVLSGLDYALREYLARRTLLFKTGDCV
ncbi:MAG: CDP-alcohol phosphatidyltransferase family protein [Thermodesulfobacteriota bacterium]